MAKRRRFLDDQTSPAVPEIGLKELWRGKHWQYLRERIGLWEVDARLNELGAEGWELTAADMHKHFAKPPGTSMHCMCDHLMCIFKRQIEGVDS